MLNRGCDVAERLCWSSVMEDLCDCFVGNLIIASMNPEIAETVTPPHSDQEIHTQYPRAVCTKG